MHLQMQNHIFLLLKYFPAGLLRLLMHGKFLGIIDDNQVYRTYINLHTNDPFLIQYNEVRGKMLHSY